MTTAEAEAHFRAMGVQIRDDITYVGPPATEQAIARAAARLMKVRNPRRDLAQAMHNLARARVDNPLAGLEVVASVEKDDDHQPRLAYHPPLADLPDATNTRPPSLVDLYGGSGATYTHAMNRMVAAGLRRGYQPGNTRTCWGCKGKVDPITLACPCFTPTRATTR